jgi:hypothetical protein
MCGSLAKAASTEAEVITKRNYACPVTTAEKGKGDNVYAPNGKDRTAGTWFNTTVKQAEMSLAASCSLRL